MKKFNILIEGTGIRFSTRPPSRLLKESHTRAVITAAVLSVCIIGYVAVTNRDALFKWDLFKKKNETAASLPEDVAPPATMRTRNKKKRVVLDSKGRVLSILGGKAKSYRNIDRASGKRRAEAGHREREYKIRFALCLEIDCAHEVKIDLAQKGVASYISEEERVMPAYRIKAGPAPEPATQKKIISKLEKLGVAHSAGFEQNYLVTDFIWDKAGAEKAVAGLKKLGVKATLTEKRKPRKIFKVVSVGFSDRAFALDMLSGLRGKNIGGIID